MWNRRGCRSDQARIRRDLFIEELRDLYSAEKQLVEALPKMAAAAALHEVASAFEQNLEQFILSRGSLPVV